MSFEIGDIVRLKCGECKMIVKSNKSRGSRNSCYCIWQGKNGTPYEKRYPNEFLELVNDGPLGKGIYKTSLE